MSLSPRPPPPDDDWGRYACGRDRFGHLVWGWLVFHRERLEDGVLNPAPPSGSGNPFVGDELLRAGKLKLRARFQRP